jgi:hypothetical protein
MPEHSPNDPRSWLALAFLILGGFLYWLTSKHLGSLYPVFQTQWEALIEGATLRFSFMPLGLLLFYILFRDWFEQSGLRLLLASVQWLIMLLPLAIIVKRPWEVNATFDMVRGYTGAPYAIALTGVAIALAVFLFCTLGTLIIIDSKKANTPRWERWLEYSPVLVATAVTGASLLFHKAPPLP